MLNKKILGRLNEQIQKEYYSSYLYLAMATYCGSISLEGFGRWLRVQSQEELGHALKLIDYIEAQQGRVELEAISKPPAKYKSVQEIFDAALDHERLITQSIHEIYALAGAEKDYATQSFLTWFVNEQVEEEASAQLIVDKLRMIGPSMGSLLYLDKELGKRGK